MTGWEEVMLLMAMWGCPPSRSAQKELVEGRVSPVKMTETRAAVLERQKERSGSEVPEGEAGTCTWREHSVPAMAGQPPGAGTPGLVSPLLWPCDPYRSPPGSVSGPHTGGDTGACQGWPSRDLCPERHWVPTHA